mgnify:FL=1
MTKEQEEAIRYLEKHINYFKEQIKFIEEIDCDYYDEEYELYKNRVKQFETVLNILKEKDKEIEFQKDINKIEKDRNKKTEKSLKGQIIKNNKTIEKLEKEVQRHFETTIIQAKNFSRKLDIKDKIIDEMATYIATLDIEEDICEKTKNEHCDKMNFGECEDCIKQYFERKVENGN